MSKRRSRSGRAIRDSALQVVQRRSIASLHSWLTRAVDLGMIGSGLGQLFPINLQRLHEAGQVQVGHLLLVGMGEPGRFAADDLRFMISNVTVAVKSMCLDQFATSLFGTRRRRASDRGSGPRVRDGHRGWL